MVDSSTVVFHQETKMTLLSEMSVEVFAEYVKKPILRARGRRRENGSGKRGESRGEAVRLVVGRNRPRLYPPQEVKLLVLNVKNTPSVSTRKH